MHRKSPHYRSFEQVPIPAQLLSLRTFSRCLHPPGFSPPSQAKNLPASHCGVQAGFLYKFRQFLFRGPLLRILISMHTQPRRADFMADCIGETAGKAPANVQGQSTCSWSVLTTITPLMTFTLPVAGQFGISWNSCVSRMARYSSWSHCSNFRPNRYIKSFR